MSGFETSMAPLWCGRHEVALQFRNARTHLPSVVLTQCLDPSTPAHRSSCQYPKSHADLSTETLISAKPKRSKFNFGYFSEDKEVLGKRAAALGRTNEVILQKVVRPIGHLRL
ncbi:hypothetical protein BPNPMPFG_007936 (plasmid) [Mesorhizobium sp. AR07]|uniref:hypothetical protein n=1 Tax=Mesorhizobium sp. AR07 TaxID=2865838 RepID=UPI00215F25C8|nr:hypothetical protein [Mesorhizobium sp. AR07]UVK48546.1 hypothetical protein BPNPMPFG_007936 [Mesorhizobium sp. AR07]